MMKSLQFLDYTARRKNVLEKLPILYGESSFVADTENTRRDMSSSGSVARDEHIPDLKQFH
jgi:hypothetical protein